MSMVEITVTEEDKEEGCRNDRQNCPLALAIGREMRSHFYEQAWAVGSGTEVCTFHGHRVPEGEYYVEVVTPGRYYYFHLPAQAREFARSFDSRGDPETPLTFTLNLPEELVP